MNKKKHRGLKRMIGFVAILLSFIGIFWNQPVYRHYLIDGKSQMKDLKIIQLSDLHSSIYGNQQKKLIGMITKEQPDLILMTGDIADDIVPIDGVIQLLEGIKDLCPIYYISGNHEYWAEDPTEIFDIFRSYGVITLDNKSETIDINGNRLTLTGLIDPDATLRYTGYEAITRALTAIPDIENQEGYRILLSHRPEHIEVYKTYEFDLVLSGHAHGGQIRIPGLYNGLFAPNQGWLPTYAGGYYKATEDMDFIVSRGLSLNPKLPRIMNPPEVVVIEFY